MRGGTKLSKIQAQKLGPEKYGGVGRAALDNKFPDNPEISQSGVDKLGHPTEFEIHETADPKTIENPKPIHNGGRRRKHRKLKSRRRSKYGYKSRKKSKRVKRRKTKKRRRRRR